MRRLPSSPQPTTAPEDLPMNTPLRHTTLPGRVRLAWTEHGPRGGTPVVALHGVTDSCVSFEPLLPHLPADLHLIALSQRGHGESEKPAGGYRPADFAADLAAFLDAQRIARAVIVGHSMGSVNALRFALAHPERVAGLLLEGAKPFFGRDEGLQAFHREQITPLAEPVPAAFAREFQQSTLAQPIDAAWLDRFVGESLKVPAPVWRAAFDGFMGDDFSARLGEITAPTEIVWGARDLFCTADDQAELLRRLPNARLLTYADAGHAVHWEEPRRFAADLGRFVHALTAIA